MESDDFNLDQIIDSAVEWATNTTSTPLSLEQLDLRPTNSFSDLKAIPNHLKYAYLGEKEAHLVIISSHLIEEQEEDLLVMLRDNKEAIEWTMADIKGLSPSIVQHHIHLIEAAKLKRDPQRRLNPVIQEAVRVKILKLLDNGIIYPISDSLWVSPVHAVPKKADFTVVENEKKELMQTRLLKKIRVCIDYCKLNSATCKDHFPLPFIDQMLERLGGHACYYFLDGYSGYNQISIAPED